MRFLELFRRRNTPLLLVAALGLAACNRLDTPDEFRAKGANFEHSQQVYAEARRQMGNGTLDSALTIKKMKENLLAAVAAAEAAGVNIKTDGFNDTLAVLDNIENDRKFLIDFRAMIEAQRVSNAKNKGDRLPFSAVPGLEPFIKTDDGESDVDDAKKRLAGVQTHIVQAKALGLNPAVIHVTGAELVDALTTFSRELAGVSGLPLNFKINVDCLVPIIKAF